MTEMPPDRMRNGSIGTVTHARVPQQQRVVDVRARRLGR